MKHMLNRLQLKLYEECYVFEVNQCLCHQALRLITVRKLSVEFEYSYVCSMQIPVKPALEVSVIKTCLIVMNLLYL